MRFKNIRIGMYCSAILIYCLVFNIGCKKEIAEPVKPKKCDLVPLRVIGEEYFEDKNKAMIQIACIDTDTQGNIYVLDMGRNKVLKYDQNGKYISAWGSKGYGPGEFVSNPGSANQQIRINSKDEIFVYDGSRTQVFNSKGDYLRVVKAKLSKFDVDTKGYIYRTSECMQEDCDNIEIIDNGGEVIKSFGKYYEVTSLLSRRGHPAWLSLLLRRDIRINDENTFIIYNSFPYIQLYNNGVLIWQKYFDSELLNIVKIDLDEKKMLKAKMDGIRSKSGSLEKIEGKERLIVVDSELFMERLYLMLAWAENYILEIDKSGNVATIMNLESLLKFSNLTGNLRFAINKATGRFLIYCFNDSIIVETQVCY